MPNKKMYRVHVGGRGNQYRYFNNLEEARPLLEAAFQNTRTVLTIEHNPHYRPRVITIEAPTFLASYWINGDASGLEGDEQVEADLFLKHNDIVQVFDVSEEADEFAYMGYPWNTHGSVSTYTVEVAR